MTDQQFELDFTPGLTHQFPHWIDVINSSVYGYRGGLNAVAAALDRSPSLLSRQLRRDAGEEDKRRLFAEDVPAIMAATGDLRPLYWLVEKFCDDTDSKKKRAVEQLGNLLPQIEQLLAQVRD